MILRLLVTGGRHYADRDRLFAVLDALARKHTIALLIHGACPRNKAGGSADMLADDWARERNVSLAATPVDHALDGPWPGAGPRRNERMRITHRPNAGVAFPGGSGTADMVRRLWADPEVGGRVWVIGEERNQ